MKTPSKNMSKAGSPVTQKAKDRPLQSIQETKMLIAQDGTRKPKGPHSTFPHSKRSEERSKHYHSKVLDGKSPSKATDSLNPTSVIPASRSYPGL